MCVFVLCMCVSVCSSYALKTPYTSLNSYKATMPRRLNDCLLALIIWGHKKKFLVQIIPLSFCILRTLYSRVNLPYLYLCQLTLWSTSENTVYHIIESWTILIDAVWALWGNEKVMEFLFLAVGKDCPLFSSAKACHHILVDFPCMFL